MTDAERQLLLDEAADLISQAADAIKAATRDTEAEVTAEAYTLPHLKTWAEGDGFQTGSIPDLKKQVKEGRF